MKLIIFDIDGTLTNTHKVEDYSFFKALEEAFGVDISNQRWDDFQNVTDWGVTEEILLKEYGDKPTKEDYDLMKESFVKILCQELARDKNQFSEIKGASSFFHQLHNNENVAIGIATGGWEESALIKLQAIGIDPTGIPFSNSNFHKTREDIINHTISLAENRHDRTFDDIIYFGDGKWDFKTCKNLGIPLVGIDALQNGHLKKLGTEHVFTDFLAVDQIFGVLGLEVDRVNSES